MLVPPKREKETSRGILLPLLLRFSLSFFFFFPLDNIKRGKKTAIYIYIYIHFPLFIVIFQSMEHDSRRLISISLNTRDNSSNFSLRKSRFLAIKFSQTILEYLANKAESWGIKINFHPLFKNIFRKKAPLTSKALLFVISPVFLSFFLFSPLLLDRTIPSNYSKDLENVLTP